MPNKRNLRLALLLVATALLVPPLPAAGAADAGRAPSANVALYVSNSLGVAVTEAFPGEVLTVNASVNASENITGATISLFMNGVAAGSPWFADLNNTTEFEAFWAWNTSGLPYGDYLLAVNVSNATENFTNTSQTFVLLGRDVDISSVMSDRNNCTLGKDRVNITALVVNRGNLCDTAVVEFLLDGSTFLENRTLELGKAGGGNDSAYVTITFNFAGAAEGNHTVLARLEGNHSRSGTTGNITVRGYEELTLLGATVDRTNITRGETVTVTANLMNGGTGAAAPAAITFHLDNASTPTANLTSPSIGPGALDSVALKWNSSAATPGNHRFTIRCGAMSAMTRYFYVMEPPAGISVSNMGLTPSQLPYTGGAVRITATIMNHGPGDAKGLSVDALAGYTPIHTDYINLSAGASLNWSCLWNVPVGYAPGNYTVHVSAGSGSASAVLVILPKPPTGELLIVSFTASPSDQRPGSIINLRAEIRNNSTAERSDLVEFFFNDSLIDNATVRTLPGASVNVTTAFTFPSNISGNVTYRVRAGGKERSIFVPSEQNKFGISIQGFISDPSKFENVSSSTWKTTTLRITLKNSLTREARATLTIADQGSGTTIAVENVTIPAGSTLTRSYQWKVRGTGTHTAVAVLEGDGNGRAEATVQLTPSTQSLCLITLLVPGIIMPSVFIAAHRRRKHP